jgi:hypothetical protein
MDAAFTMRAGRAYYFGRQDRQNDIVDRPPEPYLVIISRAVAKRCGYAAHVGTVEWKRSRLMVVLYVDPLTRNVFGQPHPDGDAKQIAPWWKEKVAEWSHAKARRVVHWLELHASYVNKKTSRKRLVPRLPSLWAEYVDGSREDRAPKPLALAADPETRFAGKGWTSWESWFWPSRRDSAATGEQVAMALDEVD